MTDDLIFTGEIPVVINRNGSADDVFAPVRSSSCDINIVSREILDDLYSASKDEIKVKIEKDIYEKDVDYQHHDEWTKEVMVYPAWKEKRVIRPAWDEEVYHPAWEEVIIITPGWDEPNQWSDKTWNKSIGLGDYIWHYDGHTYYSFIFSQYELVNGEWVDKTWNKNIDGDYIWHYDGHTYYSQSDNQYELVNGEWVDKTWNKEIKYGSYIWEDNDGHLYYSQIDNQYELINGEWVDKTWNKNIISGENIWKDNDGHVYYSTNVLQYELINGQWVNKDWDGKAFEGKLVWHFNDTNIYVSNNNIQYELINGQWVDKTWNKEIIGGNYIWSDNNGHYYYSRSDTNYALETIHHPAETETIHHPAWTEIVHHPAEIEIVQHPATYEDETVWPEWDQKIETKHKVGTELIWEGYMTPNTYSQKLSQNLDEIAMTAIDPVSLLKFIHIDKILTKPNICTYAEIIGKALALVKLDSDVLYVENSVSYESNTLLDMQVQVGNFWDEDGETSTIYDTIGEMLKIFGCCLVFQGDSYLIYDLTKNSDTEERTYSQYTIEDDGQLTFVSDSIVDIVKLDVDDWTSNNTSTPTVEIRETYDKVTAVASTSIPEYSSTVLDNIDPMDKDKYDIGHLNVELNPTRGYKDTQWPWTQFTLDTNPHWFYIWNGTYVDSNYGLETTGEVDGWNNINAFYEYLNGEERDPDETGSILNFYGSGDNPVATGREQEEERTVEIKKRITTFAPDNGVPPELLEKEDIRWYYENNYEEEDPQYGTHIPFIPANLRPELYIYDEDNPKFGHVSDAVASTPVYVQEYENLIFSSLSQQTIDIELSQGYSRTGENDPIPMITGSITENVLFRKEDGYIDIDSFSSREYNKVYCWPRIWRDDEVLVNGIYFDRDEWRTIGGLQLKPVWDKRRVDLTMEANNITYQFDGKQWYQLGDNETPSAQHAFYLKRLMNGEKLFIDDFKYNIIETSDGSEYTFDDQAYIYYTGESGAVCEEDDYGARSNIIEMYKKDGHAWTSQVDCSEGHLSVNTYPVDGVNGKVKIVFYSSSLLGVSGLRAHSNYSYQNMNAIYYNRYGTLRELTGPQRWEDRPLAQSDFPYTYNTPTEQILTYKFIPISVSYIKAEHLDVNASLSVPKSNLGQVFDESDIKYIINLNRKYLEQYEGPNFKVNTKHTFVANSYSYLICNGEVANPDLFVINGIPARPECYVTQAYLNYLSNIRKIYSKTMVSDEDIDNVQTYIRTPEINGGKWMRVLSDSYDLKTGRHSIVAVESNDMEVSELSNFSSMEIPRRARSERYNYISSNKKK